MPTSPISYYLVTFCYTLFSDILTQSVISPNSTIFLKKG